jgi:hypothetical protein
MRLGLVSQGLHASHSYSDVHTLQGYLAHKKPPPPLRLPRALGIVLLQGPRGALFLVSQAPLHPQRFIHSASGRPSAHRSFLFCRRYLRRRPLSLCKRLDAPPAFKDQGRRKTQHPAVAKKKEPGSLGTAHAPPDA